MAGKTVVVTDDTFQQQVLQSDKPVMVDFWAPWCGPCRAVAPILEDLADEYDGRVVVAKVNTDESQRYASEFGITGIPTMILFKNGEAVETIVGARAKSFYKAQLEELVKEGVAAK